MAQTVNLRVKCKTGQQVISELPLSFTIRQLKDKLHLLTNVDTNCMKVLHGYPPQPLSLTDLDALLTTLNLRSGDTLIIEQDLTATNDTISDGKMVFGDEKTSSEKMLPGVPQQTSATSEFNDSLYSSVEQGILTRKMVPPNNSCLFTAIDYVMNNGRAVNLEAAQPMRQLVARLVSENRETYSEGFLGKDNSSYCAWILDDKSWGGAIEVSILSKHYNVEIDVIDAQSGRIDRFNETECYPQRVFLFYDGTHYDPLAYEDVGGSRILKTKFSTSLPEDVAVMAQALDIGTEAKASRQFTDLHAGMMQCRDCGVFLRGENEILKHSKATSHSRYSEV